MMEGHMIYFLAVGLALSGFMVGWHARPIIADFLLNMMCHCGSGMRWKHCCHDDDVAEHEDR